MYKLILFDFFKTLTPKVYFSLFSIETRKQITQLLFKPPNNELWEKPWMSGQKTSDEVFEYLSNNTDYTQVEIETLTRKGIEEINWNRQVWAVSQRIRKEAKTAIVTINCDLFTQHIVPFFKLESYFDAVISSAEYGTICKVELCKIAAQVLLGSEKIDQALLLDDKLDNTEPFEKAGGHSILYQGEESFRKQIIENPLLSRFADD